MHKLQPWKYFNCNNYLLRMPKQYLKIFLVLLAVVLTAITMFGVHDSYVRSVEYEFYQQHIGPHATLHVVQDDSGLCRLPDYDPFDPTILSYIKKWPIISCGKSQLPLTYLDQEGVIHLNESAITEAGFTSKQLQCAYYEIKRKPNDDDHFELGPPRFIVVRCYETSNLRRVYESGHAFVRPLEPELALSSQSALKEGGFNVLIFVLDSMSRLNFMRQLPKTYQVVTKILEATVMRGLTKVGDNTYPNMIVMLSGLASSRNQRERYLGPFWGNINASRGYFDLVPAVWKNFSSRGYVTMFAEDLPQYTIFNYMAHGFHEPPTHLYMRPFWLAMDQQKKLKSKDNRCYGHVPKHRFLFNYTEQFLHKMREGRNAFFAFSFLTHLSHDSINSVQVIDGELAQLFTRLHVSGALERTVLLLMGDHGNRFDSIRKTVIGRVEERMPFLAVALPKELRHLRPSLEHNKDMLTSWHDVYETLMDVALDNLAPVSKQVRYGHRGLSLFRDIPSNRTCLQVGIPREYCVCWVERELEPGEPRSVAAGQALVQHLNRLLAGQNCATLVLERVVSAQLLLPAETVAAPADLAVLLRVTARAQPSGALLEATLERRAWSKEDRVLGDVNRINRYGNQSNCIEDKNLKLYCYCNSRH